MASEAQSTTTVHDTEKKRTDLSETITLEHKGTQYGELHMRPTGKKVVVSLTDRDGKYVEPPKAHTREFYLNKTAQKELFGRFKDELGSDYADFVMKIGHVIKTVYATWDNCEAEEEDELIQLALDNAEEVVLDQFEDCYAVIRVKHGRKCLKVGSRRFTDWISRLYYEKTKTGVSEQSHKMLASTLRGRALENGSRVHFWNRVARHGDKLYYDLADEEGRVIEIDKDGWREAEDPPVLFRSSQHQAPQVMPEHGGSIEELWTHIKLNPYLDIESPEDEERARESAQVLVLAILVSAFTPDINHGVLSLFGQQGCRKTTDIKFSKLLIDPSQVETQSLPKNANDLSILLSKHWFCAFDNESPLRDWQSDALARAVTGAGDEKRALYTDEDEVIRSYRCCIAINGLNAPVQKPDLVDRAILLKLKRSDDNRKEQEVAAEFERARPQLLGALLDLVAKSMKVSAEQEIRVPGSIRMQDFVYLGEGCTRACGYAPGTFVRIYQAAKKADDYQVVENSLVGSVLLSLLPGRDGNNIWSGRPFFVNNVWRDTPSELLHAFTTKAEALNIDRQRAEWPSSPMSLSNTLESLSTNLKALGIEITRGKSGSRYIQIRLTDGCRQLGGACERP